MNNSQSFLDDLARTTIDDSIRGVPPGSPPVQLGQVAAQGWRPASGNMPLPVLTLDEAAFARNSRTMLDFVRRCGAAIAPHAKTPMSPQLAAGLIEQGAWGVTVANLQQASVMLRAGIDRLIFANETGGAGAGHLAGLLAAHPAADIRFFADSPGAVANLASAARRAGRRDLPVLVEVGAGRAGARTREQAQAVIAAVLDHAPDVMLGGVATYEGAAAGRDAAEIDAAVVRILDLTADTFRSVRAASPQAALVLTAGGSVFFDKVLATLGPIVKRDANASLVLRSGAIFFHDHGPYERALKAVAARPDLMRAGAELDLGAFRPALRLWAEILSIPEENLAICGCGMRDVSSDLGMPKPLNVFRNGQALEGTGDIDASVAKLNDQHAFLSGPAVRTLRVGDIVEFGISHPCTCLDRWRILFGLDENRAVRSAYKTFFG